MGGGFGFGWFVWGISILVMVGWDGSCCWFSNFGLVFAGFLTDKGVVASFWLADFRTWKAFLGRGVFSESLVGWFSGGVSLAEFSGGGFLGGPGFKFSLFGGS